MSDLGAGLPRDGAATMPGSEPEAEADRGTEIAGSPVPNADPAQPAGLAGDPLLSGDAGLTGDPLLSGDAGLTGSGSALEGAGQEIAPLDDLESKAPSPENDPEEDLDSGPAGEPVTMSQLLFVDVLIVLPSSNPVIVLQEADSPYRELRIPIGGPEGIAIGYAARRIATPRPLTHELMSRLLRDFDLALEVVRITGSVGGSFTAEIVVSGPIGSRTIDCRPSDAIALALHQRLPVPIMAMPGVLEQAGSGAAGAN